jgi:hypothetical protein
MKKIKQLFSKQSMIAILLCLFSMASKAQLHGTYTIDPTAPASASNYQTITSALSDLKLGTRADGGTPNGIGVSAAVIFELASGYTSASETFPMSFNLVTGASATNTITLRPASGVATVLSISNNASQTIDLNGANYVTIDGRPGGIGSTQMLEIGNTSTNGSAIRFINEASNNTLQYCTVTGVGTSTSTSNILFSTTTGANGNDNNTIDHCDIKDGATTPLVSIYSLGTTTTIATYNSGNTISNNNIYNYFNANSNSLGIGIVSGTTDWIITDNSFYQTITRTSVAGTHSAINVSASLGNNFTITNNYIGGSAPLCSGSPYTLRNSTPSTGCAFVVISLGVGSTTASNIQGNVIQNIIDTTGNTTSNIGINFSFGLANITSNTIGSTTLNNSLNIVITASAAQNRNLYGIAVSSTATVNINNNTIGGVNYQRTGTDKGSMTAISIFSTGFFTANNNTIGSLTLANSLFNNAGGNTTGINCTGSSTIFTNSFTNNTIANITSTATSTSAQTIGINVNGSGASIIGNTIRDLISMSTILLQFTGASVVGIAMQGTTRGNLSISQNTIYNLMNNLTTNEAVVVEGIAYNGPVLGTNEISKNTIYALNIAATNTQGTIHGLTIGAGIVTVKNNIIRLGLDALGNAMTEARTIYGLFDLNGTNTYLHNSVYIGGNTNSSLNSTCFYHTTSNIKKIYNNIFVNVRSNIGSGSSVAIYVGNFGFNNSLKSGNNCYYTAGTGTSMASIFYQGGKRNFNQYLLDVNLAETNSFEANPQFIDATNVVPNLHVAASNPIEGMGNTSNTVIDDIDGDIRTSNTPVDIGADAGNFTLALASNTGPNIALIPIGNGSVATSRNLNNFATIFDVNGINTTAGSKPRIYYKKNTDANAFVGNTSSNNGWKWVEATNNSSPFSFIIDYTKLFGGTVSNYNVIQYFVVAQNNAGNVNCNLNAGFVATSVSNITVAPTSLLYYTIFPGLPTTITVGTGGTYTSLTNTGGLFQTISSFALTGNTTVNIISDLLAESGTYALSSAGLNGYSLKIKPSIDSIRTISNAGDLSTYMIRLVGASNITIDGSYNGAGHFFRITNTTGAANGYGAISFAYNSTISGGLPISCTNDTIKNCIIEHNSQVSSVGNIYFDGSGYCSGIVITNNDLKNAQGSFSERPNNQIYSGSALNNTITISNNNIYNYIVSGVTGTFGDACVITGNSFYYNYAASPIFSQNGISITAGDATVISNNYIGGAAPMCGGAAWENSGAATIFRGIDAGLGLFTASSIQGNTIQNINLSSTINTGTFYGISINAGLVNVGTIAGNTIGHSTITNSIQNAGTSGITGILTGTGTNVVISNNEVANLFVSGTGSSNLLKGIHSTSGIGNIISNNNVHHLSANGTASSLINGASVGIYITGNATNQLITQNNIYNLSNLYTGIASTSTVGIATNATGGMGSISKNKIFNLTGLANNTTANTSQTARIIGLSLGGNSGWTMENNQISITNSTNTNKTLIEGILEGSSANSGTNFYLHNTVYIGGANDVTNTFNFGIAFLCQSSIPPVVRNNLFYNDRTTYFKTAIMYQLVNSLSTTCNNNVFVAPTDTIGSWASTNLLCKLSAWQTNTGGDANSYAYKSSALPAASVFTDAANGDLSLTTAYKYLVSNRGTSVTTSADYINTGRNVTQPTVGAFEYATPCSVTSTSNLGICAVALPYSWNGLSFIAAGSKTAHLINSSGCDSAATLNLFVNPTSTSTTNTTICASALPYSWNGFTLTGAGSQIYHTTNYVGCDSAATLNLTVISQITYYADADNDGFGDAATSQLACTQPTGYVTNNTDCDDAVTAIHAPIRYYLDTDGDGFGGSGSGLFCSITAPTGYAAVNGDCNNNDASVHVAQTYFVDADNDGYGSTSSSNFCSSTAPTGYSVNNLDCNDAKATATLAPVANAGADRTICKGDTITIGATAVSGTNYYWYTTTRLIGIQVSNPKVYPSSNFKYVVLATNAGGCRMFDTMNVIVKNLPTINAGIDKSSCPGLQNLLGTSIPTSANTTYQWTPALTQTSSNGKSGKAYPTTTTDYVIKVTNTISGCSNRDTVRINILPTPFTDAGVDRTICAGDTITIGSAAQSSTNYYWYTNTRLIGNRISNPKIYPTNTSKYIVLGVNAQGCRKFDTMNVTVNQLPIANAGIDKSIVTGGSIQIGTTAKSGLLYAWLPTTNLSSSTVANPISSATSTTNYVVKVTATATGCMKNDTMVLMVAPARIRSIVANQPNTIETINSDLNFNIYPNPSNGVATITFAESIAISTIEVVNMQGQVINNIKLEANQSQVELQQSNTNAGMYLVIAKNIQGEIIAKKTWVVSQ